MASVVEETESTATRCGVIDNFGNHRLIITEIKFVAYTDFTRRFYKDIPQFMFGV